MWILNFTRSELYPIYPHSSSPSQSDGTGQRSSESCHDSQRSSWSDPNDQKRSWACCYSSWTDSLVAFPSLYALCSASASLSCPCSSLGAPHHLSRSLIGRCSSSDKVISLLLWWISWGVWCIQGSVQDHSGSLLSPKAAHTCLCTVPIVVSHVSNPLLHPKFPAHFQNPEKYVWIQKCFPS